MSEGLPLQIFYAALAAISILLEIWKFFFKKTFKENGGQ